jgi:hypothetical protein
MDQIHILKRKIESSYYQVTQIAIDNRPRLQKLQNMFNIKVIMKTANEAIRGILDEKDLNIAELSHLIFATDTVVTEEINGPVVYKLQTGEYKLQTGEYKLQTGVYKLQTGVYKLQTGEYKLQTGECKLQTGEYKLQRGKYKLQTQSAKTPLVLDVYRET